MLHWWLLGHPLGFRDLCLHPLGNQKARYCHRQDQGKGQRRYRCRCLGNLGVLLHQDPLCHPLPLGLDQKNLALGVAH